jgi:hypothetical protein
MPRFVALYRWLILSVSSTDRLNKLSLRHICRSGNYRVFSKRGIFFHLSFSEFDILI